MIGQYLILLRRTNWFLTGTVFALLAIGLVTLASIAPELFAKQLLWAAISLCVLFLTPLIVSSHAFHYRSTSLGVYALSIALLVFVRFVGVTVNGARSWIDLGSFQFQPSEFAKVALILILALFLSRRHAFIRRLEVIGGSFAYFALPAILVMAEPDLGSALILFGIWFSFLLVAELPLRAVVSALALFVVVGAVFWQVGLKPYHKERILGLFDESRDALGVNYNAMQSKIAVGSAGLFGKGFGQGSLTHLGFLPSASTDFIFSAFVEEWGSVGGSVLIIAFMGFVTAIALIGMRAERNTEKFICLGAVALFLIQFAINIGSAVGLLPVIGVTLPFVSYGGSNLLISGLLVGIIQSIVARTVA
ncbi:MAG: rod shape-determining protein RodA [Candidatus Colwellbacteria bacterium]|nr:rod shape-determining protein RodA [Candidatus Colwellbacteria bacterium]